MLPRGHSWSIKSCVNQSTCPPGTAGGIVSLRLRRTVVPNSRVPTAPISFGTTRHSTSTTIQSNKRHGRWQWEWQYLRPKPWPKERREPHYPSETDPFLQPVHYQEFLRRGKSPLLAALERNDPDLAHLAILYISKSDTVSIKQMSTANFLEVLRLIDPECSVKLFDRSLKHFSPKANTLSMSRYIEQFFIQYDRAIRRLLNIRWYPNEYCKALELKFLLKTASVTGNANLGQIAWHQLKKTRYSLDSDSHKHYLGSQVYGKALGTFVRQGLDVTPPSLSWKSKRSQGYSSKEVGGIRDKVVQTLQRMQQNGLEADAECYAHALVGFSRVGDLDGVALLLKDAWGIDVNAVLHENSVPKAKVFPSSSPLQPTGTVLTAIADAYGSCDQSFAAVRLIDFISTSFGLTVPIDTWEKLLDWLYKFSKDRVSRHLPDGGPPSLMSLVYLWNTIISPPYNVQPSPSMRSLYIRALIRLGARDEARQAIEEGRLDFLRAFEQSQRAKERYKTALEKYPPGVQVPKMLPSLEQLRKELHLAQLETRLRRGLIYRWLRFLLYGRRIGKRVNLKSTDVELSPRYEQIEGWNKRRYHYQTCEIPNAVEYWLEYLPQKIWYQTATGMVEIKIINTRMQFYKELTGGLERKSDTNIDVNVNAEEDDSELEQDQLEFGS